MSRNPEILWWRTSFGDAEIQRLIAAVESENISQGPVTAELEKNFARALHVPYALVTTSGSVALLMALMALGIGPGDEVIVPDRTWIATAHAPLLLGARVVLVDSRSDITTMDVGRIREKITPRTKAIMPVHMNGRAVDMDAVNSLAREFGLAVVEDACQALFSRNDGAFLGTRSDAGCFSLGVTKLISTGQGGVVVTKDEATYERLKLIRNHGVVDNFTDRWDRIGFNFKFTDLQAAFGLIQLARAEERVGKVRAVYDRYKEKLAGLPFLEMLQVRDAFGEVPLYLEVLSDSRDRLVRFLADHGVQARPSLPSLHTSQYLKDDGAYPNSDRFAQKAMYLPCGPAQPTENIDRVIDLLHLFG